MQRAIERVRGFYDMDTTAYRQFETVLTALKESFRLAGFSMIDVPVLEQLDLYLRKNGAQILSKLYGFTDQGRREVALRPEFTASVIRALGPTVALSQEPVRVAYAGPVFRYEKPQRATTRQFTQAGVELLGDPSSEADADIVALACKTALAAGVPQLHLVLGHLGPLKALLAHLNVDGYAEGFVLEHLEYYNRGAEQQRVVRTRLGLEDAQQGRSGTEDMTPAGLADALEGLSPTEARDVVNGLLGQMGVDLAGNTRTPEEIIERVLSKAQRKSAMRSGERREHLERALTFCGSLSALQGEPHKVLDDAEALLREYDVPLTALRDLKGVVELLHDHDLSNVQITLAPGMARGIAYYSGLIFELYADTASNDDGESTSLQICGGGRYDGLSRAVTGRSGFPALGFAFGVERMMHAVLDLGPDTRGSERVAVLVAERELRPIGLRLAEDARQAGIVAVLQHQVGMPSDYRERFFRMGYAAVLLVNRQGPGTLEPTVSTAMLRSSEQSQLGHDLRELVAKLSSSITEHTRTAGALQ
ncbi:MAG: histidyl-tRNA synthetase [Chloroflexi bacterium]|nr:histidyl-tRNA synthetase [Chloroflexota bacterium]